MQIIRARTDGSVVERITADSTDSHRYPDVSADGGRIVYAASSSAYGEQLRIYARAVRDAEGLDHLPRAELWLLRHGRALPVGEERT